MVAVVVLGWDLGLLGSGLSADTMSRDAQSAHHEGLVTAVPASFFGWEVRSSVSTMVNSISFLSAGLSLFLSRSLMWILWVPVGGLSYYGKS